MSREESAVATDREEEKLQEASNFGQRQFSQLDHVPAMNVFDHVMEQFPGQSQPVLEEWNLR
jgi:hypothetical protein